MIIALTRDGQFKVEAITDDFVTLDTNTRMDMMAKLDAVVEGDMDDSYKVRDENVNESEKSAAKGQSGKEGDNGEERGNKGSKKGKKRAITSKNGGGGSSKKRKISTSKI